MQEYLDKVHRLLRDEMHFKSVDFKALKGRLSIHLVRPGLYWFAVDGMDLLVFEGASALDMFALAEHAHAKIEPARVCAYKGYSLPRLEEDDSKPVDRYIFTCGVCFGVVVLAALFMAFHHC